MFEYPTGKSSSDYTAPADYTPQFAGFENLNADQVSEMNTLCGEDYVSLLFLYSYTYSNYIYRYHHGYALINWY